MTNGMTYIVRPRHASPRRARVMRRLHLGRRHPVVGDAGVGLVDRADEGAVLDAGDVARVGGGVEGVRLLRVVQPGEGAGLDELGGEAVPLLVRAVTPHDALGGGQGGDLVDPGLQALVTRPRLVRCLRRHGDPSAGPAQLVGHHPTTRARPAGQAVARHPPLGACCHGRPEREAGGNRENACTLWVSSQRAVGTERTCRGAEKAGHGVACALQPMPSLAPHRGRAVGPERISRRARGSGSLLSRCARGCDRAPVAQRIEHLTTDQKVRGSNPFGRALC